MRERLPTLGLMLGDMTGIGPEISAKVLASGMFRNDARIAVVGDAVGAPALGGAATGWSRTLPAALCRERSAECEKREEHGERAHKIARRIGCTRRCCPRPKIPGARG